MSELYVTEDTTEEELLEYVRECVEDPVVEHTRQGKKIVWNFSSHDVVEEELNLSAKHCHDFVIPFQVTSTWAMMFTLLPERIRNAENLVWKPSEDTYYAYNQFYRKLSDERRNEFKNNLSKVVDNE